MEVSQRIERAIALAREIEQEDPIDWEMLQVSEDEAYRLIALGVVERLADKYDSEDGWEIVVSTIVHLVVENFVLNLKLQMKEREQ